MRHCLTCKAKFKSYEEYMAHKKLNKSHICSLLYEDFIIPFYKTGWKVVTKKPNGNLCSILHYQAGAVRYIPGKDTYPKHTNGPLCVFKTRAKARQFAAGMLHHSTRVYKCQYTPSKENKIWIETDSLSDCPCNKLTLLLSGLPTGTVLAKSVKLLNIRG